ncbi:MAG: heparinase II/III family protein [Candidatus Taylorbacteria bacterium]
MEDNVSKHASTLLLDIHQQDFIGKDISIPAHPRILMLKGEENTISTNIIANETWNKLHQTILSECENLISIAPLERVQIGRRLLDTSREALRRIFFLSYAYRLTKEQKYFERALKEMLSVCSFTDWNHSSFLDTAEMTMAVSIGYDWLYSGLSEESKSIIKEGILKKGLEPSMEETLHNGWLKRVDNWNQVCNAGMTYGAIAIYEDHPDLAKQIINRAIESIKPTMKSYEPDGVYSEGYMYWNYGTSFNLMFLSAIEKVFGKDFGLSEQPGFLKTATYLEHMTGPTGDPFNYSDAMPRGKLQVPMFWFGAKLKDPSLIWVEYNKLLKAKKGNFVKDRLLPAIMVWGNGIDFNKVTEPKSKMYVGQGKNPVAIMRTSWTNPDAIFVGTKGGSASINHAHMDIGSFVMEANGVRWAMDFGMQDYESLESKGIYVFGRTQDAERWNIFRYNNLVHNTLTVNNEFQEVDGYAPIVNSSSKASFMSAIIDMTEVYKKSLLKANRGIAIVDQKHVVIRDEIETHSKEVSVRWTLLTPADVKIISKNTAELTKDGKKLILYVKEPVSITMKTWSTVSPNSYDADNSGTTLVGFEVNIPADSKIDIVVNMIPGDTDTAEEVKIQPLKEWIEK